MKKIILILIFCLAVTENVKAACWGSVVGGKNGHSYCVSNQLLDVYASLGWCAAQGRHLASINEACDYGTDVFGTNANNCPNLVFDSGVYFDASGNDVRGRAVWTATVDSGDSGRVYVLSLGYLGLHSNGYTHWFANKRDNRALCY